MIEQVMERYGRHPAEWLVDGGYPAHEQLAAAAATSVYAPLPKPKDADTDPHVAKAGDSDALAAWRARMGTDEAKDMDTDRAAPPSASTPRPGSVTSSACGSVHPQGALRAVAAGARAQPGAHPRLCTRATLVRGRCVRAPDPGKVK